MSIMLSKEEMYAVLELDLSKLDISKIEKRALEKVIKTTKDGLIQAGIITVRPVDRDWET